MKTIRVYLSVYPWWYKLLTLFLCPIVYLVFVVLLLGADKVAAMQYALKAFCAPYVTLIAVVEIETDFFSVGAIYKKKEPFGKCMLTSRHAQEYYRKFIVGDILRRSLYCVIYAVPVVMISGMVGVLAGLSTLAALQLFTWVVRHVQHSILMIVILWGTVILMVTPPTIAVIVKLNVLNWILAGVSLVVALLSMKISMLSAKKIMEGSYYDK